MVGSDGSSPRAEPGTERGKAVPPSRRSPQSIARARDLRQGDNMAEAVLWMELKARRLGGYKSVLRFWNVDALKSMSSVCETILAALGGRLSEDVEATDLRFVYAKPKVGNDDDV